jgi:hypothetical protein
VIVGIGRRWRADTPEDCANADKERAQGWTNRAGQGIHRDRAREKKPNGRAEYRRPILGSQDPTPPERNPCDDHRREESTEDPAYPETAFAESMTDHRSDGTAKPTEDTSNKE